jgi:predicted NBD/HSP70 family sugar kinase
MNLIRHVNELKCLRLLRRSSPLSRAEVAREIGLTRATAGSVVNELLDQGYLVELNVATASSPRVGRPGRLVSLNPFAAYFVGVDVSRSWLTAVTVDLAGRLVRKEILPNSPPTLDPTVIAQRIAGAARAVVESSRISNAQVRGVGISVPGIVRRDGLIVSSRLMGWTDVDIASPIASALLADWPVRVCNDVVALASALGTLDDADPRDVLVVLLSEGIGGAVIRGGRIVEGASGFAGEIGHMVLSHNLSGGRSRTFGELAGQHHFLGNPPYDQPIVEALEGFVATSSAPHQRRQLREWGDILAVGLLNLTHILNPSRIVIGGPLASLFPLVQGTIEENLKSHLLHGLERAVLDVAGHTDDAVAIGAAGRCRDELFTLPDLLAT